MAGQDEVLEAIGGLGRSVDGLAYAVSGLARGLVEHDKGQAVIGQQVSKLIEVLLKPDDEEPSELVIALRALVATNHVMMATLDRIEEALEAGSRGC